MTTKLQEQIEKAAETHIKKAKFEHAPNALFENHGLVDGMAIYAFNSGAQFLLKLLSEMPCEFSEQESYLRLGYDCEKEPGVKRVIEGARGQYNEDKLTIAALREELARLKGGGK